MQPRHAEGLLARSMRSFPVVTLTGPRQVGKSTLAEAWAAPARYLTLDDRAVLDQAISYPGGFLAAQWGPVVVDEAQRAPDLLRAVKRLVVSIATSKPTARPSIGGTTGMSGCVPASPEAAASPTRFRSMQPADSVAAANTNTKVVFKPMRLSSDTA
jgi:hypothetical protein